MSPYSESALRNLQKGVKKMSTTMSPAAKIRRDFQLGRPPKALTDEPLHPTVVCSRAEALLSDLRARMVAAGLTASDVEGWIIYVRGTNPDPTYPEFIPMGQADSRQKAFKELGEPDTVALGVIFQQIDGGQRATFAKQLTGLSELGQATLRKAGGILVTVRSMLDKTN